MALNSHRSVPDHHLHPDIRHFPEFPELTGGTSWTEVDPSTHEGLTLLADVVAGRGRRRSRPDEITVFLNNMGLGVQFAGVGAAVLDGARRKGLGRDLPSEWFTQDVHP